MHMRGTPKTMQKGDLIYDDLLGEIIDCLRKSIGKAMRAGVRKECLIVDPGIGFGKTWRIIIKSSEICLRLSYWACRSCSGRHARRSSET